MYCFLLYSLYVCQGCIMSLINPAEFVDTILCLNIFQLLMNYIFSWHIWEHSLKRLNCVSTSWIFFVSVLVSVGVLFLNLLCHDDALTFINVIIMHDRNVCLLQKQPFVYHFNFVSWRGRIKKAHLWHLKINHLFTLLYNQ